MRDHNTVEVRKGDAFEEIRELEDNSYQAAVVDYPWEFDTANGTGRFGHNQSTGESDLYEREDTEGLARILSDVADAVESGGWVFVFTDDEKYPEFRNVLEAESGLDRHRDVYWDSECIGMGTYHRVQAYPILTATVGKTERYLRNRPNIYRAKHHAASAPYKTMKPVELYRQMLEPPVLEDSEAVLTPFAGTFPAGVVARERECGALGWDISDEALAIARERITQQKLPTNE